MKRTLLFAMLLALLFSLATVGTAQDDVVTLTFWHHWGGNRIPLMDEQIAAFEEAYPNIQVDSVFLPWDNRLENLLTAIAAGDPPDVTMFGRQDLPFFAATESIIPLDDYMAADGMSPDIFIPSEFVGTQYNDQTWMLPLPTGGALNIMWYNKTHFAEAGLDPEAFPETWEELLAVGEALRQGEGGFLDRVGFNPLATSGAPDFINWINANGQDWISEDLRTVTINNQAGIEALEFMVEFTNDVNFGIEEVNAFYEMTGEFDQTPFILGLSSIDANGSWQLFQYEEFGEDLDFGIASMPYGPSGSPDRRGVTWGGWGYMVPKNASHPAEAWELVKWLTTEVDGKGACWFIQQQQRPSPLQACDGYLQGGETHPRAAEILEVAALDHVAAISPVQPQADEILVRMVDEVLFGEKSVEEALADAEAQIQELLDIFWEQYG
jgi:multiple sugar transport system substrate-binding protein